MSNKTDEELVNKLIKIFDDLLEEKGWDGSFLLKVAQKRLLKARSSLHDVKACHALVSNNSLVQKLSDNQAVVYVSLHQAGGSNLVLWEQMLKVISACSLGRPIYQDEDSVIKAIMSRPDIKKEAYVEVVIDKSGILNIDEEKRPVDHNGVKLLTLQQGAVNVFGIRRFVYANKLAYKFIDGKLISE
jgi:Dot/Icm secretion system protein IcmQ